MLKGRWLGGTVLAATLFSAGSVNGQETEFLQSSAAQTTESYAPTGTAPMYASRVPMVLVWTDIPVEKQSTEHVKDVDEVNAIFCTRADAHIPDAIRGVYRLRMNQPSGFKRALAFGRRDDLRLLDEAYEGVVPLHIGDIYNVENALMTDLLNNPSNYFHILKEYDAGSEEAILLCAVKP